MVRNATDINLYTNHLCTNTRMFHHRAKVLIVQLERYKDMNRGGAYTISKDNTEVYPEEVIWLDGASVGSKEYKLVSVVLHHGENTNSGHYTAVVRKAEGGWYVCNDNCINEVESPSDVSDYEKTGYICIYEGQE